MLSCYNPLTILFHPQKIVSLFVVFIHYGVPEWLVDIAMHDSSPLFVIVVMVHTFHLSVSGVACVRL